MSREATKKLAQTAINRYNTKHHTMLVASTSHMTVVDKDTVISEHGRSRVVIQRPRGQVGGIFEVISVK